MRPSLAVFGLALGLLSGGCSLVENGARVAADKVRDSIDDCAERRRDRSWAEQAWEQARKEDPGGRCSTDYADGFKDGFADYLYRGGDGEPPPLPPNRYRALRYQTPLGYQAIEDWFDGFRRGALEAKQGGYRQWVTGPSSLRSAALPPPAAPGPAPAPVAAPLIIPPPPAAEELPPPRPAPPKEEKQSAAPPPAPTPVVAQAAYRPGPPPAPAQARARFRGESNRWEIAWDRPDGRVGSTTMSPGPFAELVRRLASENKEGGERRRLAIDDGACAATMDLDDESFEGLAAYLTWYYEDTGE